jgi:5-methylcytosine-specific restriction endonuclease McrA
MTKRNQMENKRVLVLNKDFQPLDIISWQKAMIRLHGSGDSVSVVKYYDDFIVNSADMEHKVPAVMIIKKKYVLVKNSKKSIKFNKNLIYLRDKNTCQYCGNECNSKNISVDHVVPKSKGGNSSWSNLVACCLSCNGRKGDRTCAEFGVHPLREPTACQDFHLRKLILLSSVKNMNPEWSEFFAHIV